MKPLSQTAMAEATRLTTEGRLDEAMALLRGVISGASAPSSEVAAEPRPARPKARQFIDMVPPSPETGECWKSPLHTAGDTSFVPKGARMFPGHHPRTELAGHAPVLPKGARFEQLAFANEAGSRHYKLYIPSSLLGQPAPLLMMLHGCTQSPDDFAAGTRMNLLAEEFGFLAAYPAQAKSSNPSKCWNWFRPGDQRRGEGEPALIAGIAQQIAKDYPIARSQIYVAGLSAGGAAAAIMGEAYPDISRRSAYIPGWPVVPPAISRRHSPPCGRATRAPSCINRPALHVLSRPSYFTTIATAPSAP